ncbi:MFS transporter [Candidatus Protochlamydia sp. W-9]|uniref:MFS transporter n=1 Tax=Candidatus Protochlamydia sp. W-9 TaxID=1785087 RepID=UPI00096AC9D4|nr:MFS transporter [Candidatus Protochlamydia sp. W-9]
MVFTAKQSIPLSLAPLLALTWLAHFFIDTMLGIWPVYKSMAQLDFAKAGLVVAAGAFIGEGAQLFFGAFSDRGYRKHLMILGLLLVVASTLVVQFSHYGILFCLYLFTCLGSGSFHPAAGSLMGSLIPTRRGLLMAIFASGGSLGLAFSQLIFLFVYKNMNAQTYLLAIPAIILSFFLIFYRFPVIQSVQHTLKKGILRDFKAFFCHIPLRMLYLVQVANQSILWGMIFILPDALKTLGLAEWIYYGGGHLCLILGGACMMVPAGYLADKYSPRQVILYAGIVSCATFYFILFFGSFSMWLSLLLLFILGASLTLVNPIGIALGVRYAPGQAGSISAFLMGMVWCISEAIGPGSVGLMTAFFENYAPIKALAVLGLLFLIQIYATFSLPKEEQELVFSPC